jgi:hypothetical protein
MNTGPRILCPHCTWQNAPGTIRCEDCKRPLPGFRLGHANTPTVPLPREPDPEAVAATSRHRPAAVADGTTRLLCAAAHRHEWFAEGVIREYLVDLVGTVPPSPGLDTAVVLRDAVAARARHRARDAVLLLLLTALTVLNPLAMILWTVAGMVGARWLASRPRARTMGHVLAWAGVLALLLLVGLIKAGSGLGLPAGDRTWWPSLLIATAMLVVLVTDIWLARTYLRRRCRPHNFVADHEHAPSGLERRIRGLGLRRYAAQLERFADADEHSPLARGSADVIVHRGENPFVGAGYVLDPIGVPIVLRPAAGRAEPPARISVRELYERVATELVPLAAARKDGLIDAVVHREQLLIPADELLHQRGTSFGYRVLENEDAPPVRHVPVMEAHAVAAEHIEWARYYSCLRRESWNRNLVTSCYLNVTMHGRTLQVDVTHCVLPPVRDWLKEADRVLAFGEGPLNAGSVELLRLPITILRRVRASSPSLRPRTLRTRGIDADRYGSGGSLREGVSPRTAETHYFTRNDATRQVKMLHNELFAVVVDYLVEQGYDVSELRTQAATLIQNHVMNINNSTFVNADITNGAVNPPQQPAAPPTPAPATT